MQSDRESIFIFCLVFLSGNEADFATSINQKNETTGYSAFHGIRCIIEFSIDNV